MTRLRLKMVGLAWVLACLLPAAPLLAEEAGKSKDGKPTELKEIDVAEYDAAKLDAFDKATVIRLTQALAKQYNEAYQRYTALQAEHEALQQRVAELEASTGKARLARAEAEPAAGSDPGNSGPAEKINKPAGKKPPADADKPITLAEALKQVGKDAFLADLNDPLALAQLRNQLEKALKDIMITHPGVVKDTYPNIHNDVCNTAIYLMPVVHDVDRRTLKITITHNLQDLPPDSPLLRLKSGDQYTVTGRCEYISCSYYARHDTVNLYISMVSANKTE